MGRFIVVFIQNMLPSHLIHRSKSLPHLRLKKEFGVPVAGIVSSVLILDESISIVMASGAGMMLFGIAVFAFGRR